jgi:hypothetical protein
MADGPMHLVLLPHSWRKPRAFIKEKVFQTNVLGRLLHIIKLLLGNKVSSININ